MLTLDAYIRSEEVTGVDYGRMYASRENYYVDYEHICVLGKLSMLTMNAYIIYSKITLSYNISNIKHRKRVYL